VQFTILTHNKHRPKKFGISISKYKKKQKKDLHQNTVEFYIMHSI